MTTDLATALRLNVEDEFAYKGTTLRELQREHAQATLDYGWVDGHRWTDDGILAMDAALGMTDASIERLKELAA